MARSPNAFDRTNQEPRALPRAEGPGRKPQRPRRGCGGKGTRTPTTGTIRKLPWEIPLSAPVLRVGLSRLYKRLAPSQGLVQNSSFISASVSQWFEVKIIPGLLQLILRKHGKVQACFGPDFVSSAIHQISKSAFTVFLVTPQIPPRPHSES